MAGERASRPLRPSGRARPAGPPRPTGLRPQTLTRALRLALLALVAVLGVLGTRSAEPLLWVGLLALAAVPGLLAPAFRAPGSAATSRPSAAASQPGASAPSGPGASGPGPSALRWRTVTWVGLAAEVAVVVLAAAGSDAQGIAVLPYLVAPAFAAGVAGGAVEAAVVVVAACVGLLMTGTVAGTSGSSSFVLRLVEWGVLSAVAGAVGVGVGRLDRSRGQGAPAEPEFAQAARLLTQLRTVARQLPGTLDPGSIAERLLDELHRVVPADRGAVLTGSGGGRLEVLAQRAPERVAWETSLDVDAPIADAWVSQQPQTAARSLDRSRRDEVSSLVLPLVTGVRTVGLVVLESDRSAAYPPPAVAAAAEVARKAALGLETALLFDEIRGLATVEERQRLAREIHDGVAQELVMVGYGIDNATAELRTDPDSAEEILRALRGEVTRVITELRLSLFELRSDVDRHGGLGTAIAEYTRTVAASAGFRVHLSLEESTARLPAAVESELLRIAQEAVTNARKHAAATNLWVSCEVDPPYARLEISDDGRGVRGGTADGRYGVSIMAERADRVRALLEITARNPRGTTVSVVLGQTPGRGSVTLPQEVRPDSVQ